MITKKEIIEIVRPLVKDKINYDWEEVLGKVYDIIINSIPGLDGNNPSYTIIGCLVILCIVKDDVVAYVDVDLYNRLAEITLSNKSGSRIDDNNLNIVKHSWVYIIKKKLEQLSF